jgi:hypothetical protein
MDRSSSYSPSKIGSFGSDEQISGLNEQIPGPGQSYLSDIGPTVWERVLTPTVVQRMEALAGGWGLFLAFRQGNSMFLAFQYGVLYVLSFATVITAVATALALVLWLVMIVGRSVWRLLR